MSDSGSTKLRRFYYVANPGSSDSEDDYRHYSGPQQHRIFLSHNQPKFPTTAAPDSYTSTTALESFIFVTSDSERYVAVDVSGARTAIQIRELILTKVCSLLSLNPLLPHPPPKATHLRRRREPPILNLSNRDWCICHGRGFDQRSPLGALPRSR